MYHYCIINIVRKRKNDVNLYAPSFDEALYKLERWEKKHEYDIEEDNILSVTCFHPYDFEDVPVLRKFFYRMKKKYHDCSFYHHVIARKPLSSPSPENDAYEVWIKFYGTHDLCFPGWKVEWHGTNALCKLFSSLDEKVIGEIDRVIFTYALHKKEMQYLYLGTVLGRKKRKMIESMKWEMMNIIGLSHINYHVSFLRCNAVMNL